MRCSTNTIVLRHSLLFANGFRFFSFLRFVGKLFQFSTEKWSPERSSNERMHQMILYASTQQKRKGKTQKESIYIVGLRCPSRLSLGLGTKPRMRATVSLMEAAVHSLAPSQSPFHCRRHLSFLFGSLYLSSPSSFSHLRSSQAD